MLKLTVDQDVATITMERPEKGNALSSETLESFIETIQNAEREARVLLIRGSGGIFSAGADLTEVKSFTPTQATAFARLGQRLTTKLAESPLLTIAAIDGHCRGGGMELILACDLRFATPDASFGEPGVKIGLFGCWGGTYRLPQIIGTGHAMDLSVTGRTLDAEEAHAVGLVSRVVNDRSAVESIATAIASHPQTGLQAVKAGISGANNLSREEALTLEAESFGSVFKSDMQSRIEEYL